MYGNDPNDSRIFGDNSFLTIDNIDHELEHSNESKIHNSKGLPEDSMLQSFVNTLTPEQQSIRSISDLIDLLQIFICIFSKEVR